VRGQDDALKVAGNENEPRGVDDEQEKVAKLGAMIWWWWCESCCSTRALKKPTLAHNAVLDKMATSVSRWYHIGIGRVLHGYRMGVEWISVVDGADS
jgi:hypothetical protein